MGEIPVRGLNLSLIIYLLCFNKQFDLDSRKFRVIPGAGGGKCNSNASKIIVRAEYFRWLGIR